MGSRTTNRHGVAAFDFATVSGCDQLVVGPTHARQVNWNTICGAIRELPWRNIWLSDNPVEVLNKHLSLLVGRYVPTKVIRVRNKDKPKFNDQCRHAFGFKQETHLRWTCDRPHVNC